MSERKKSCTGFGKRKLILFCHLLRLGLRYESEDCHQATHQWADDIEEAERQIYQGRDAEHGTLRHTASRPWYEHGGNGGANERYCAVDALLENVGDGVEHIDSHHART